MSNSCPPRGSKSYANMIPDVRTSLGWPLVVVSCSTRTTGGPKVPENWPLPKMSVRIPPFLSTPLCCCMPQFYPKHAQTMPKIYPNLSVIVEILITRLMSPRRRDITVDRRGPTV